MMDKYNISTCGLTGEQYIWYFEGEDLRMLRRLPEAIRELEKRDAVIEDAARLLCDIMTDQVNAQDEAEKWLRAYAPEVLSESYNSQNEHTK